MRSLIARKMASITSGYVLWRTDGWALVTITSPVWSWGTLRFAPATPDWSCGK